jgi:hypothetical protein
MCKSAYSKISAIAWRVLPDNRSIRPGDRTQSYDKQTEMKDLHNENLPLHSVLEKRFQVLLSACWRSFHFDVLSVVVEGVVDVKAHSWRFDY